MYQTTLHLLHEHFPICNLSHIPSIPDYYSMERTCTLFAIHSVVTGETFCCFPSLQADDQDIQSSQTMQLKHYAVNKHKHQNPTTEHRDTVATVEANENTASCF